MSGERGLLHRAIERRCKRFRGERRIPAGRGVASAVLVSHGVASGGRVVSHPPLAGVQTVAVTSVDADRDEYIRELRAGGWSVIEIADEVGLSRSQVHRILAAAPPGDDGDELDIDERDIDGGELALLGASGSRDERELVPPIQFVGVVRGVDGMGDEWRYVDAVGSVSGLELYRYRQMLDREGRTEELAELEAALDEQIAACPELVKVVDFLGQVNYRPVWKVAEAASRGY